MQIDDTCKRRMLALRVISHLTAKIPVQILIYNTNSCQTQAIRECCYKLEKCLKIVCILYILKCAFNFWAKTFCA